LKECIEKLEEQLKNDEIKNKSEKVKQNIFYILFNYKRS